MRKLGTGQNGGDKCVEEDRGRKGVQKSVRENRAKILAVIKS